MTTGLQFFIGWWYRKSAVFYLPQGWFGPLTWWLALPWAPAGSVSCGVWQMACQRIILVLGRTVKEFWRMLSTVSLPAISTHPFLRLGGSTSTGARERKDHLGIQTPKTVGSYLVGRRFYRPINFPIPYQTTPFPLPHSTFHIVLVGCLQHRVRQTQKNYTSADQKCCTG